MKGRSVEYFRRTREERFGKKLEEVCPDEEREKMWVDLEEGLRKVKGWFGVGEEGERERPFMGGNEPCYADIMIVARFLWARAVWGGDSEDWKRLMAFDGGRWERYLKSLDRYFVVV